MWLNDYGNCHFCFAMELHFRGLYFILVSDK